ncbi:DUF6876 family protein [Xanthocytophaga flava]|uniref:DUF6876 family protein n=1 Tax=Xanthocytophaga flava TaxID=3048013 RepID=UPI0028D29C7A|nr:DUF6876 family protein [Xanthocytophaga flavus]MDJ1470246.1 hypothetical protein [Xanthocytophaga flavus]
MKSTNTPAPDYYFSNEIPALEYSLECMRFKKDESNIWFFELIALYQTLPFIANEPFQCWQFKKHGSDIIIMCSNEKGEILQNLSMDIGNHHNVFFDVSFLLLKNKCMLEHEYLTITKMSA